MYIKAVASNLLCLALLIVVSIVAIDVEIVPSYFFCSTLLLVVAILTALIEVRRE